MTNQEAHKILDKCLNEGQEKNLYGQTSFIMHWQNGKLEQITDKETMRTWRSNPNKDIK